MSRGTLGRSVPGGVVRVCAVAALLLCSRVARADDAKPPERSESPPTPMAREFGLSDLAPRLTLHGFADVTANVYWDDVEGVGNSSRNWFALGELDLFMVSHLADNVSFLSELVIESEIDNETAVELERIFVKYTVSDRFWLSVGRHHTALGYWNEAFHHGLLLQPTDRAPTGTPLGRARAGSSPCTRSGLAMGGRVFRGPWGVEYAANIGNGRGLTSREIENGFDCQRSEGADPQAQRLARRKRPPALRAGYPSRPDSRRPGGSRQGR